VKNKTSSRFLDAVEYYTETYIVKNRGLSENTQESYKCTFRLLLEFMYEKKNVTCDSITFKMLDLQTIMDFCEWISTERNCSDTTLKQRKTVLRSFSKFAQNWDYEDAYLFRNVMLKVPDKKVARSGENRAFFSEKEIQVLLSLPNTKRVISESATFGIG